MTLSPENQISYTRIIDGILATSDLDQVTVKKIRSGLELAVGQDLTEHKAAIKELIGERFDKFNAERAIKQAAKAEPKPVANGTNGSHKRPASPSESASISATPSSPALSEPISDIPPKKKVKRAGADDADAALAARLQAEENGRARPTRGGGITKKRGQTVKKSPMKKKKKSANRIKADDDSALSGESGDDAEPTKRGGAFNKPWDLSYPLAALTGEPRLSRPQTVKKIWEHIKANDLQFPDDKRQIRCDEPMRAVFGQDKVHMFSMNKYIGKHLYPVPDAEAS